VTEETFPWPKSKFEEQDNPGIGQFTKDIASTTGASAPRISAAAKQFGLANNEYAWLFNKVYDASVSDLDPKIKEQHLACWLAEVPGIKNLIGVTRPRDYTMNTRREATIDESLGRYVRNNKVEADAIAYYWKGVGKEENIDTYIESFDEESVRESLMRKKEFVEKTAPLPHRESWVHNFHKTPEWKATDYYNIWKRESSPEDRAKLDAEYEMLIDAGYISKDSLNRFESKLDELLSGK
jgi:hypothetical protein